MPRSSAPFTVEQHWQYFVEFVRLERAVGGPDPHMVLVGHMSRDVSEMERLWRAGCYVGVYNVPAAEVIWRSWSWEGIVAQGPVDLTRWLRTHWSGIPTRRERRCVRSPEKLARFLLEYAAWIPTVWPEIRSSSYQEAWNRCQEVYAMGRYATMKLLEFWHRYCGFPQPMPDIRARGGMSPRQTLALLMPEHKDLFLDDAASSVGKVEVLAEEARSNLRIQHGFDLDHFLFQVLLCDYRQSCEGQRQYPGRSHDSELDYRRVVEDHFGAAVETEMLTARQQLFPAVALGERVVGGWTGVRKELGRVLRLHGYTWSDVKFSYPATKDLAHPIMWENIEPK